MIGSSHSNQPPVKDRQVLVLERPEPNALTLLSRPLRALQEDEVLLRVRAAGICGTDLHIVGWNSWAAACYRTPVALGHEVCGDVVERGAGVRHFTLGDRVVLETHLHCGRCRQCRCGRAHLCDNLQTFSRLNAGGFADLTIVPARLLRAVPDALSDAVASMMEPLGIAYRCVAEPGEVGADLLVVGCGPIGLMAIAIARALGVHPIASDPSAARRTLALSMGAASAIDPNAESVPDAVRAITGGGVMVSVDTSGTEAGIDDALASTLTGGTCMVAGLPEGRTPLDLTRHVILREVRMLGVYGRRLDQTWVEVERLLLRPGFDLEPLITHRFPLHEYAAAFEMARSAQAGKVIFDLMAADEENRGNE